MSKKGKNTQQNTTSSRENSLTNISKKNENAPEKKKVISPNKRSKNKNGETATAIMTTRQLSVTTTIHAHVCTHHRFIHFLVKSIRLFIFLSSFLFYLCLTWSILFLEMIPPIGCNVIFKSSLFYKYLWANLKYVCYD